MSERQWRGTTDGTPWMHRALVGMLRVLPVGLIYFFMGFSIPVYMLLRPKAYLAIYHYFRRRHGYGVLKSYISTWRNHLLFGEVVVDRFAAFAGRKFTVELGNNQVFMDLLDREEGFMMIGAHVGNDEMSGYMLKSPKRVNALIYGGEGDEVAMNRMKVLGQNNVRLIPVKDDMSHLFTLYSALADGEIVNIHADRLLPGSKTVPITLLGAPTQILRGPFSLATTRDVPVVSAFIMKEGAMKYRIHIARLDEGAPEGISREEKEKYLAERYASELEAILRKYPCQWFNFHEFWDE
ncbi:MAG: hypothetical protein IKS22_06690 [Bacteroidales bacterium]|nr:hypothetical protein [Bacteroidales bacterium]